MALELARLEKQLKEELARVRMPLQPRAAAVDQDEDVPALTARLKQAEAEKQCLIEQLSSVVELCEQSEAAVDRLAAQVAVQARQLAVERETQEKQEKQIKWLRSILSTRHQARHGLHDQVVHGASPTFPTPAVGRGKPPRTHRPARQRRSGGSLAESSSTSDLHERMSSFHSLLEEQMQAEVSMRSAASELQSQLQDLKRRVTEPQGSMRDVSMVTVDGSVSSVATSDGDAGTDEMPTVLGGDAARWSPLPAPMQLRLPAETRSVGGDDAPLSSASDSSYASARESFVGPE